jgi:hypothetical protein
MNRTGSASAPGRPAGQSAPESAEGQSSPAQPSSAEQSSEHPSPEHPSPEHPSSAEPSSAQLASEQRRESRRTANGPIVVRFGQEQSFVVHGHLVDVSASGFRMLHQCTTLETGQIVEFSHPEASGTARVMWNRIVDRMVQTGFFVMKP